MNTPTKTKSPRRSPEEPNGQVRRRVGLKDLTELCAGYHDVELNIRGEHVSVRARKLLAGESAKCALILKKIMPPLRADSDPNNPKFDLTNPDYMASVEEAKSTARALALYLSVPMFSDIQPGLADEKAIRDFVEGTTSPEACGLTEDVLETLYMFVASGSVDQNDEVKRSTNFF